MADQAQRIVFMLKKFQTGHKYTTTEVYDMICKEYGEHSLRTVQRDMLLLQECEPAIKFTKAGKEHLWYIPRDVRNSNALMRIDSNEILSFYILKAHLKTFTGTVIEEDVNRLADKIEKYAPHNVFAHESLFWDQNIGYFDYSQCDENIRSLIKSITDEQWIKVSYNTSSKGKVNQILVLLRCMFSYSGSIYAVAYVPKHDTHIALAVQNIESIEFLEDNTQKAPDFDFSDWTKNRFGVFYGEIRRVTISVHKDFKHYFINRRWHQSQVVTEEQDGSLTLDLKVPIGSDFLAWLMSWGDAIKVERPNDLIKLLTESFQDAILNYQDKV